MTRSVDGKLAWLSEAWGGFLVIADGDGSASRIITTVGVSGFDWSPDGKWLAYTTPGESNENLGSMSHGEVRVVDASGNGDRLVHKTGVGMVVEGVDWSPDSTRLVFSEGLVNYYDCKVDLIEVEVQSGRSRALTRGGCDFQPEWSPDSTEIAFARLAGFDISIWVVRPDSPVARPLTGFFEAPFPLGDLDLGPTWSPDGSRIAYERGFTVATIRRDGSDDRLVAPESDGHWYMTPAWSPDGTRLAVTDWGEDERLVTMNPDGSDVQVVKGSRVYFYPSWSPDGKWITADSGDESLPAGIFAVDGSAQFFSDTPGARWPAFAPA